MCGYQYAQPTQIRHLFPDRRIMFVLGAAQTAYARYAATAVCKFVNTVGEFGQMFRRAARIREYSRYTGGGSLSESIGIGHGAACG